MIFIITKILKVKPEIKNYVIAKYVQQCKLRHLIAFIEWRLYYSNNRRHAKHHYKMFDGQLEDMINDVAKHILKKYDYLANNYRIRCDTVEHGHFHPIKGLKMYGLDDKCPQKYNVNSFQEVGWPDPFPDNFLTYKRYLLGRITKEKI